MGPHSATVYPLPSQFTSRMMLWKEEKSNWKFFTLYKFQKEPRSHPSIPTLQLLIKSVLLKLTAASALPLKGKWEIKWK